MILLESTINRPTGNSEQLSSATSWQQNAPAPMRSPATSIVPVEAVRRSTTESGGFWATARIWPRDLLATPSTQDLKPNPHVSVVHTIAGPFFGASGGAPFPWLRATHHVPNGAARSSYYKRESSNERRLRTDMNTQITTAAKTRNYLKRVSTSISLVILTLGFSLLGLLTFINSNREGVINALSFENSFAMVGSSISILLGVAFLVAASLYWSRYSRIMD
jgi:hypothetical protein